MVKETEDDEMVMEDIPEEDVDTEEENILMEKVSEPVEHLTQTISIPLEIQSSIPKRNKKHKLYSASTMVKLDFLREYSERESNTQMMNKYNFNSATAMRVVARKLIKELGLKEEQFLTKVNR